MWQSAQTASMRVYPKEKLVKVSIANDKNWQKKYSDCQIGKAMTAQGELRKEIENQKELYWLQHSKENKNALGIVGAAR